MLEAVTVCVNYDDLLEITLPSNSLIFDKLHVITTKDDIKTQKICEKFDNINCVVTDLFYEGGAKFKKGAGINEGFRSLIHKDWVAVIDADVILPKVRYDNIGLNPEKFYGSRRYCIRTRAELEALQENIFTLNNYTLYRGFGYGYFQLFNWQSKTSIFLRNLCSYRIYPETPTGAESDWIFRNYWGDIQYNPPLDEDPHSKLSNDIGLNLLEELKDYPIIHLGVEGINETGRFTERF